MCCCRGFTVVDFSLIYIYIYILCCCCGGLFDFLCCCCGGGGLFDFLCFCGFLVGGVVMGFLALVVVGFL